MEADIADLIAELATVIMIIDATTSVISKLDYLFLTFFEYFQIVIFLLDATKVVDMVILPIPIRDLEDLVIAIVAVVLEVVAVAMETATVSIVEHVGATIGNANDHVANVPLEEATEVVKNLLTPHPQAIVMPSILAMLKKNK